MFIVVMGLSSCHQNKSEHDDLAEIRYFILEHLDDGIAYQPLSFQRIDNGFLSSDSEIMTSLLALQDTVKNQFELSLNYQLAFDSPLINDFLAMQNEFEVDLIDELLMEVVKLEKAFSTKAKASGSKLPNAYLEQRQLFTDHFTELNAALSNYNLSAYHLDLSGEKSKFYIHQYSLDQNQPIHTVFELSTIDGSILSFKDVS